MVKAELTDATELPENQVDQDISQFNDWFQTKGNEALARSEYAIIKTYLAWKLGLAKGA
jgi:hypothetical protein